MNKHKISPEILNEVNILSDKNQHNVFISSNNFDETKKFLIDNKYKFIPYRFAKCFNITANSEDLKIFSNQNEITYISSNPIVLAQSKEKDIISFNKLCENKYFGQGQTICFIDTGIHPHLDFILPKNRIVKFVDFVNNQIQPYDDNGHGTFVSGIACGNGVFKNSLSGFATQAKIISLKALSTKGKSESNLILDAMQWVYENHKAFNIGIVCMSFGAESLNEIDPLSRGAEALWKRGIVVVAAAGNSGPNKNSIKSPGNNPNIITVGALDVESMSTADFSSRGPTIYGHKPDLLAPAVNITSCSNTNQFYTKMSGTSVATPIVAGICAVIKCKYPKITNNEIKQYLLEHCKKITGDINTEGAGYINFDWLKFLWYNRNMIKFENVNINYVPQFSSLLDFSFCFNENILLIGDELSGANTVLRLIAKFDKTYSGNITIDNKNIKNLKDKELNVAFVSHEPFIFKFKNLEYNLGYGLNIRKTDKKTIKNEVDFLIKKYNLQNFNKKLKELTLSEIKIITLLRAIIRKPKYLLLEYFFENLDTQYFDLAKQIISDSDAIVIACEKDEVKAFEYFKVLRFNCGIL